MTKAILVLINTIQILSQLLGFAILARVLLSWVKPGAERQTTIGEALFQITEPILNLARMLPHRIGMMDLSAIIALFGLDFVSFIVIEILKRLA